MAAVAGRGGSLIDEWRRRGGGVIMMTRSGAVADVAVARFAGMAANPSQEAFFTVGDVPSEISDSLGDSLPYL